MTEPNLEVFWSRLGHPAKGCSRCGKETHDDGSPVLWRCHVCGRLVCRECTLLILNFDGTVRRPPEYYEQTLCTRACWETAGKPDE